MADEVICQVCGDGIIAGEELVLCRDCGTPHHGECFRWNGRCSTYACSCATCVDARGATVWENEDGTQGGADALLPVATGQAGGEGTVGKAIAFAVLGGGVMAGFLSGAAKGLATWLVHALFAGLIVVALVGAWAVYLARLRQTLDDRARRRRRRLMTDRSRERVSGFLRGS